MFRMPEEIESAVASNENQIEVDRKRSLEMEMEEETMSKYNFEEVNQPCDTNSEKPPKKVVKVTLRSTDLESQGNIADSIGHLTL